MQILNPKELIEILETDTESLEIIDVRNQKEYDECRLEEVKLIPLTTLPLRISEIDPSKKVIFLCKSGGRSGQAALWAESEGIIGYNLEGGMDAVEKEYSNYIRK